MRRNLEISKPFILVFLMMALVAVAIPPNVMGAFYVDIRFGPALALLVLVGLNYKADAGGTNGRVVLLAVCVLTAVRIGTLAAAWVEDEKQVFPVLRALEKIEPGATLFAASAENFPNHISATAERRAAWHPSMKHVASYAVLAHPIFVPMTYANPTQQPLTIKPPYVPLKTYQGDPPISIRGQAEFLALLDDLHSRMSSGEWPKLNAAYIFVVGRKELEPIELPSYVTPVDQGERFILLRFTAPGQ